MSLHSSLARREQSSFDNRLSESERSTLFGDELEYDVKLRRLWWTAHNAEIFGAGVSLYLDDDQNINSFDHPPFLSEALSGTASPNAEPGPPCTPDA